jgi:hypothetical protein
MYVHGNQLTQTTDHRQQTTDDRPQTTDRRPQTTHFKSFLLPDKPRGALPGLGWYYHWYVQISIGNEFWGPLNQKRGGCSEGYGFTIDRETNPPQATSLWS